MAIINSTDNTLEKDVAEGVVLLDFWAPWCGPCKMIAPVLDQIDAEMGNQVKVVKVNVDENPESAGKYEVMSIPSLFILKNGEKVKSFLGFQPKDKLVKALKENL